MGAPNQPLNLVVIAVWWLIKLIERFLTRVR
jgi:hypothetical protein